MYVAMSNLYSDINFKSVVNLDDLWIGDILLIKKSGRVGKFGGKKDGKAIILIEGKKVITSSSNLALHTTSDTHIQDLTPQKKSRIKKSQEFNSKIDLHIEKLNPSLVNSRSERILDFQISAAKNHIEQAIKRRRFEIEIIHGKGTGVLKSEVYHLLSLYNEVKYHISSKSGGATEVLLHYS